MIQFPNAPNSEMFFQYKIDRRGNGSLTHTWFLQGEQGAVHVWATAAPESNLFSHYHYGGIEVHHKTPPDYMEDREPSHERCWILDAPCWHDGSSLQFEEAVAPALPASDLMGPDDHRLVLQTLKSWYKSHLGELK